MSITKALIVSILVALVAGAGMWVALNRKVPPDKSPAASTPAAPPNPAHEKASLEEQLKKKPGHAPVLLRLAQIDLEQNQPAEARRRLEELLKAEPTNVEALLELGRACYAAEDLPCAIAETGKILEQDPKHPDALYNLGAILANQGQAAKAREYWTRAVQAAPDSDSGRKAAAALKQL